MNDKLAVITGTFNPTTNAHLALGEIARNSLGDECIVVFVPARHSFLASWKHMDNAEIIPDEKRFSMLSTAAMSRGYDTSDCEIHGIVSGKTIDTLQYLSSIYGIRKERTYYVCGSDKLPELEIWHRADELLSDYQFLVIQRNHDDIPAIIQSSDFLRRHQGSLHFVTGDEENQEISASVVRKALQSGEAPYAIKNLVPENVFAELERMYMYETRLSYCQSSRSEF